MNKFSHHTCPDFGDSDATLAWHRNEIEVLRELLRESYVLAHSMDAPWPCRYSDCPGHDKPMRKSCGCFLHCKSAHEKAVRNEIGLGVKFPSSPRQT